MKAFYKKSISTIKDSSKNSALVKNLGALDLIMIGLGSIVGAGAFVITGQIAAKFAGPAVMLSYSIAGIVCIFVALAYAELAVMLPTSGSVYTYSYVAYGEIFAWIMGSIMFLEMGFGAAAVAAGWSSYVQSLLTQAGFTIPESIGKVASHGGFCDLLAVGISCFSGLVVYLGTKDSKRLNTILVIVKFAAIAVFIFTAVPHFDKSNWENFMPFGFDNVLRGSSILFFAFSGFGVIATAAEECKNPKRDLTIGITGALILSTIVYVVLGGLVTGIVPFDELDNAQPLAYALKRSGSQIGSAAVAIGATCGMTTVLIMQVYGLSRIFYVIARDGLIPVSFSKLHAKHKSPYRAVILFTILISIMSGFMPFDMISKLASMAGLVDYTCVVSIVLYLRFKMPELTRHFKCPAVFIIGPVAIISCLYLLLKQIVDQQGNLMLTGVIFIIWIFMFTFLYFLRSKK